MTDEALVAKKLAQLETYVRELRTLARLEVLDADIREQRFVAHTLQLAVQTAVDVASHIVADERLGEPETLRDLFDLLARGGWIDPGDVVDLRAMAGFRNLIVHEYAEVDFAIVRRLVEERLDDLLAFAAAIRSRLAESRKS